MCFLNCQLKSSLLRTVLKIQKGVYKPFTPENLEMNIIESLDSICRDSVDTQCRDSVDTQYIKKNVKSPLSLSL